MYPSCMRVISMVPSWTETLIQAGIEVVGRTRYCIHPADKVSSIPVVGGTKDWDLEQIKSIAPNFIILDKEENPKFMSEQDEIPLIITHVTSVQSMPNEISKIIAKVPSSYLENLKKEWLELVPFNGNKTSFINWGLEPKLEIERVLYVIWKNPWMVVSRDTFVGSVLTFMGFKIDVFPHKYPEIDLSEIDNKSKTLLLFSSEPYPFLNKQEGLANLGCPYGFVDGESLSWFGIRTLNFLQSGAN